MGIARIFGEGINDAITSAPPVAYTRAGLTGAAAAGRSIVSGIPDFVQGLLGRAPAPASVTVALPPPAATPAGQVLVPRDSVSRLRAGLASGMGPAAAITAALTPAKAVDQSLAQGRAATDVPISNRERIDAVTSKILSGPVSLHQLKLAADLGQAPHYQTDRDAAAGEAAMVSRGVYADAVKQAIEKGATDQKAARAMMAAANAERLRVLLQIGGGNPQAQAVGDLLENAKQ